MEGNGWLLPDLDARLAQEQSPAILLDAITALEVELTLLGVSTHLLAVSRRPSAQ